MKDLKLNELEEVVTSNNKVFIDFYADWCRPCMMMMPIVEELEKEVTDTKFYRVNVDLNREFAEYFKIMSIPTFLVFKDHKLSNKIVGMREKEDLIEELK